MLILLNFLIAYLVSASSPVGLGTIAPQLQTVSVVYNSMDQVESVQTGSQVLAQYQYDIEGRLFKYINAMGNAWMFSYDLVDRPNSSLNPLGRFWGGA
jgi:YD repeat-containing protein